MIIRYSDPWGYIVTWFTQKSHIKHLILVPNDRNAIPGTKNLGP